MEIISLKGIGKKFGDQVVLKDVNLSVNSGDLIGIIGRSGSGKSVLIKIIIGFLKANTGKLSVENAFKDKINFSMQNNSIHSSLTVKQNLRYFAKMYGLGRKERNEIIKGIIDNLELNNFENVIVKKLSGGTQKRVDIGCALLNSPEVIVLDEPFLGLDPELVSRLSKLILDLNKKGKTIIISSHNLEILRSICSKFVMIKDETLYDLKKEQTAVVYKK